MTSQEKTEPDFDCNRCGALIEEVTAIELASGLCPTCRRWLYGDDRTAAIAFGRPELTEENR